MLICEGLPEPTREEILSKSEGVDAILWATHERLNAEALDRAGPQLKAISTKSAGIDYVDVAEVKRRSIPLGYTPNVLSDAVADLAIGLMISAARRFHEGNIKIIADKWETGDPVWMLGQDIKGSTVGIVGFGGIGQAIAKRLQGFNINALLYTGHKPKPEGSCYLSRIASNTIKVLILTFFLQLIVCMPSLFRLMICWYEVISCLLHAH